MLMFIPVIDVTARMPSMAIPLHGRAVETMIPMNAIRELQDETESGLPLEEPRLGRTYNEQTFRYFLSVEEKRSDRSSRPFLLLLVDLKEEPGKGLRFEHEIARKLF